MQVSARILGQEYGLTAEEMNRVLLKQGFLQGVPGDYSLTEKARQYAVEKGFHRGTGGYDRYNRYWITRTFDDSIKEALDVSSEMIKEVRDELSASRATRYAAQSAARAKAEMDFLAKQAARKATVEAVEHASSEVEVLTGKGKKVGKVSFIVGGAMLLGYVGYKVTPMIKEWWHKRKRSSETNEKELCQE